jgi:hypothetical protein
LKQFITDVVVELITNGLNHDSGVFMVSPDGQETKYHLQQNTRSLLHNVINDIDINSVTGEFYSYCKRIGLL